MSVVQGTWVAVEAPLHLLKCWHNFHISAPRHPSPSFTEGSHFSQNILSECVWWDQCTMFKWLLSFLQWQRFLFRAVFVVPSLPSSTFGLRKERLRLFLRQLLTEIFSEELCLSLLNDGVRQSWWQLSSWMGDASAWRGFSMRIHSLPVTGFAPRADCEAGSLCTQRSLRGTSGRRACPVLQNPVHWIVTLPSRGLTCLKPS